MSDGAFTFFVIALGTSTVAALAISLVLGFLLVLGF
jgi:hypothetical protein